MNFWRKFIHWFTADPLEHDDQPLDTSLLDIWEILREKQFVDLTVPFEPGSFPPPPKAFSHEIRDKLDDFPGNLGTHAVAPAHLTPGLRTLGEIDVREMILPLVVLDIHEKVAADADYVIDQVDLQDWESRYGLIPVGAFVALRTDWSKRGSSPERRLNQGGDGLFHFPGWSQPVLEYLIEDRKARAVGHETAETDPGLTVSQGTRPLATYTLSQNTLQVGMLTNLDRVPPWGALAVATFPKPTAGSVLPARVFAITN